MIRISDTKSIHPASLGPIEHRWEPRYDVESSGWRRFTHYDWFIRFTVGGASEPISFSGAHAEDIYMQITGHSPPPRPTQIMPDLEPVKVIRAI
jgi:hypothetical protein